MTRLLLADLRHHLATWAWTAVVCLAVSSCAASSLAVRRGVLVTARAHLDAGLVDAATVMSSWILVGVALTGAAVLTTTVGLAVGQRARDHGLWRALGMRPATLAAGPWRRCSGPGTEPVLPVIRGVGR